jgi:uncharacterized membrane protein (UPF0127 family)
LTCRIPREMRKRKNHLIVGLGLLILIGFWVFRVFNSPHPIASAPALWSPTQAQAKLPTVKVWLGSQELVAEVARQPREVMTGMMFRTSMASNEAMLFLLHRPQQASFYMRNTLVPLSCAYIDGGGIIREIHDMKPKDETSIISASQDIEFVLEVPQGWFQKNNIGPETLVRSEKGTLRGLLEEAR